MDALLNILIAGFTALGLWVLYLFATIIIEFITRPFRKLGEQFLKSVYNSSFLLMSLGFLVVGVVIYFIYIGAEYFRLAGSEGTSAVIFIVFSIIMLIISILFLIGLHTAELEEDKSIKNLKQEAIKETGEAMIKETGTEIKDEVKGWLD